MLHRSLGDALFQRGGKVLDDDDGLGPRVLELVLQLTGGVEGVHVDHHQTRTQNGRYGHRVLRHIGHHDGDTVALAQTQRLQVSRHGQTVTVGLGKAEILAHETVGRTVCVFGKTLFKQAHQRAVMGGIDVGWNAFGVTLEPNGVQVHVGFSCGPVYLTTDG